MNQNASPRRSIGTSQARFFLVADAAFELLSQVMRKVSMERKTAFRGAALLIAILGSSALLIAIADGFVKQHVVGDFYEAHRDFFDRTLRVPPYTEKASGSLEETAVASSLMTCVNERIYGRGFLVSAEAQCTGQLIANAALSGGDERASKLVALLKRNGFRVPGYYVR